MYRHVFTVLMSSLATLPFLAMPARATEKTASPAKAMSIEQLQKASDAGDADATYRLAHPLLWGADNTPATQKKGVALMEKCLEQQAAFFLCHYGLAYAYDTGEGVAHVDKAKAFQYALESVKGRSGPGAWMVASDYALGSGVPQNLYQSAKYYVLTIMYYGMNGEDVPSEVEEEYRWVTHQLGLWATASAFGDALIQAIVDAVQG